VLGPDGVPTSIDGETVYQASDLTGSLTILPASQNFLLGGVLARDTSCRPSSDISAEPPACGYWTVDGLVVGNRVPFPTSAIGSIVVVRIQVASKVGTCVGNPCRTSQTLVVVEVVWVGPTASVTEPPPPVVTPPPVVPQGT